MFWEFLSGYLPGASSLSTCNLSAMKQAGGIPLSNGALTWLLSIHQGCLVIGKRAPAAECPALLNFHITDDTYIRLALIPHDIINRTMLEISGMAANAVHPWLGQ